MLRSLLDHAARPSRALLGLLAVQFALQSAPQHLSGMVMLRHLSALLLLGAITWLAIRCVAAVSQGIIDQHPADGPDNLNARRIHTQTRVLARTAMGLVGLVGVAAALMTFPAVRQLGASLLASAGLAGLVVGFAAKPVLGNLLAGLQIAMTQPIRLDDVVIVEGEWGRIEEITGSYVVVRIWDERRLIVPLQWFIEHPFQNWTRSSSAILGSVFIWVDYGMPLSDFRTEAQRLCEAASEWDTRLCLVQVTETTEKAMQLRVLVSAADSSLAWDLRCKLREGLVEFVRTHHPDRLPTVRASLNGQLSPPII